jgi:hypothetical protein
VRSIMCHRSPCSQQAHIKLASVVDNDGGCPRSDNRLWPPSPPSPARFHLLDFVENIAFRQPHLLELTVLHVTALSHKKKGGCQAEVRGSPAARMSLEAGGGVVRLETGKRVLGRPLAGVERRLKKRSAEEGRRRRWRSFRPDRVERKNKRKRSNRYWIRKRR